MEVSWIVGVGVTSGVGVSSRVAVGAMVGMAAGRDVTVGSGVSVDSGVAVGRGVSVGAGVAVGVGWAVRERGLGGNGDACIVTRQPIRNGANPNDATTLRAFRTVPPVCQRTNVVTTTIQAPNETSIVTTAAHIGIL
jgi:hypothetical protein